ncbi:MAG: hypothetical protein JWQ71_1145 [Pedosphaera sp.]|nr:hypothetical protein [Pedosphaera sp.]
MRSSTLIVSYLWKDTWKRWFEQPGSPLARWFITLLLMLVASVILVSFQLMERSLRNQMERFGLNTLLVRETVIPGSAEFFRHGEGPDHLAILKSNGEKLRVRQLFVRGQTEWQQNNLLVFSYPPEAIPTLARMLSVETPVMCLSDTLPTKASMQVRVGHRSVLAGVVRPQGWLRLLSSSEDVLLVPQGWLSDEEQLGWLDTTIFQRGPTAPPMEKIISAVNTLSALDQRPQPQIQSALPLVKELDDVKNRQAQWRNWLAVILGVAVSLVYGSIAVLEFRQNLFVCALLRSFGAPSRWLYLRQWLENLLLANLAALTAVLLVAFLHRTIFSALGFSADILDFSGGNPYAGTSIKTIFIWINVGALLSSLPVALGLRRPVGEILN